MDNTVTPYFSSAKQQSFVPMDGAALDDVLKRMKELEAQNGELYKLQNMRQYDEPIIAKYLAEQNKQMQQLTKVNMDVLSLLRTGDEDQNVAIEIFRDQLEVVRKRLENLAFIENEDVARVSDETVQLLLDYLHCWYISQGTFQGRESDYQKRYRTRVYSMIRALKEIQKLPNTRAFFAETTRVSGNITIRTQVNEQPLQPPPSFLQSSVQDWLQKSGDYAPEQPRLHRQGTPRSMMSPAPSVNQTNRIYDENKKKSETLEIENKGLKDVIVKMEEEIRSLKAEVFAIKENEKSNARDLQAAMQDCANSFHKLERLDSECSVIENRYKQDLDLKDAAIQSLQKKNSELLNSQELFQLKNQKLQEEMKPLKIHNEYLMRNLGALEEKNRALNALLSNQEELEKSCEASKKEIVELTDNIGNTRKLLTLREKEIEKLQKIIVKTPSASSNPFVNMKDESGPVQGVFLKQILAELTELEQTLVEKNHNIELLTGIIRDMKAANCRRHEDFS